VATQRLGEFEWDIAKAASNARKHGVAFEEAITVFRDPLALHEVDTRHVNRFVLVGASSKARLLFVVYAERHGATTRIISARRATPHERKTYEDA